jgi:hypothetical protein
MDISSSSHEDKLEQLGFFIDGEKPNNKEDE